jgi:hypothetical protein
MALSHRVVLTQCHALFLGYFNAKLSSIYGNRSLRLRPAGYLGSQTLSLHARGGTIERSGRRFEHCFRTDSG